MKHLMHYKYVIASLVVTLTALFFNSPVAAMVGSVAVLTSMADATVYSGLPLNMRLQLGVLGSVVLDANEVMFFNRQLEKIKSKSYDVLYPEFKALSLLPVVTDAGPGATTIVYYQYDMVGVAKIISSYAKDLPRADVKGKEFSAVIKSIGTSYGYNVQEIRSAAMAGVPLEQRRANAARRANDQKVNSIGWFGDSANGLLGLLNHPNVTRYALPADGTGASKKFINKTPNQIIRDVNNLLNNQLVLTKGIESADTVLMTIEAYTYISTTPRSDVSDTTILEFLKKNHPGVTFEWLNEAAGANGTGGAGVLTPADNVMVAYKKDADKLSFEIPVPFEQFAPQQDGLEFEVPCHSRNGGVIVYYPLSISIAEGV